MRSPLGEGTMPTSNDVAERSCWSSDTRTPTIPNPGERSPGAEPPGRQEQENRQRSQRDRDRPLLQRQHPQPGASPKLTPPCGRRGRAATRLHWGPREESCQMPSPSKQGQPRREPLPAAVLLRSSDAGPAHRGLDDHLAPGNILERRQGLSEDSKNGSTPLSQNFPVSQTTLLIQLPMKKSRMIIWFFQWSCMDVRVGL